MSTRNENIDLPLPDTRRWLPRTDKSAILESAFFHRCRQIEQRILQHVAHEISMTLDNFDSGTSVEDLVRGAIRELLPGRYSVSAGVVTDSLGFTAGDCDVVVHNDDWFPTVKSGATHESRRRFFAIDGVYAVLEVKQSLGPSSLDKALEKLVTCKRLYRPQVPQHRVAENSEIGGCEHNIRNPLFAGVLATRIQDGVDLNNLLTRFVRINQSLPRADVVNSLCILDEATLLWGYHSADNNSHSGQLGDLKPALFMNDDLHSELIPVLCGFKKGGSPLFELARQLTTQLYHTILAPEDVTAHYGLKDGQIRIPVSNEFRLKLDPLLTYRANRRHNAD